MHRQALLDAAAFLDSTAAKGVAGVERDQLQEVAQRFLATCYDDLGIAPKLLDGETMAQVLTAALPRRFGRSDPLAAVTEPILEAFLEHLAEHSVFPGAFETRQALAAHTDAFRAAVAAGAAHRDGVAVTGPVETVRHRAAKVGRNDPCPCGSGRKFKKCCMGLSS
ncbi:MAG: SEC-C metal-binding domain-containing protein [Planctomycetota bacterium]